MTERAQKLTPARRTSRKGKRGHTALARREEVVRLALALVPIPTIATRIGVARETVHRMLGEPEVAARLASARTTAFDDSLAELRGLTRRSVGVLSEELEGDDPATRVRAAVEVLKLAGAAAPKRMNLNVNGVIQGMTDDQIEAEFWREHREMIEAGETPSPALLELMDVVAGRALLAPKAGV